MDGKLSDFNEMAEHLRNFAGRAPDMPVDEGSSRSTNEAQLTTISSASDKETLDRTINEVELEPAASIDIMPTLQALKAHAIGLSTWCNKKDISKGAAYFHSP
ncbi:uncharacterized protein K444DRAFT_627105 [Hyaloscypha bicolor E]|uniref:Uncharacterized protein n=1 Tax=Hyaloscypha bicolor E TaxID=1095630 RepID=A0A2J6TK41_9HELO|nr:uncharacterized protein K444DRAFT_627105 [Hyaloscypha bicolor E]PMD63389.1 hypothetical protein K444DRAFT_627105 [Hyaloscypha bicolor E]